MIKPISVSSLSFKAKTVSARDAYEKQVAYNSQIAKQQNDKVMSTSLAQQHNFPVPMQGQAQKLDVIA